MFWRGAILLSMLLAAGCSGPARVPPPGTGMYGQPNAYYQPPGAFTAPTYGAPVANPAIGQAPNFSRNAINLAATSGDPNWQSRQPAPTTPAATGGTINPKTTLTTIRGTNPPAAGTTTPSTTLASNNLQPVDIAQLPRPNIAASPVVHPNAASLPPTLNNLPAPPATYPAGTYPGVAPAALTPVGYGGGPSPYTDPWRGR